MSTTLRNAIVVGAITGLSNLVGTSAPTIDAVYHTLIAAGLAALISYQRAEGQPIAAKAQAKAKSQLLSFPFLRPLEQALKKL